MKNVIIVTVFGLKGNKLSKLMTEEDSMKYKIINPLADMGKVKIPKAPEAFIELFNIVYGSNAINGWYRPEIIKEIKRMANGITLARTAKKNLNKIIEVFNPYFQPTMEQLQYLEKNIIEETVFTSYRIKNKKIVTYLIKENINMLIKLFDI